MALLSKPVTAECTLTIMAGPDKGTVINLVPGKITVGRGSDNDIVIKDDAKVSRNHAKFVVSHNGVTVSDISDRNKVIVNGKEVKSAVLTDGAVVELGETRFRFHSNVPEVAQNIEIEPASNPAIIVPFGANIASSTGPTPGMSPRTRRKAKGGVNFFYIAVGIISIFLFWVMTSKPNPSNGSKNIDDSPAVITANEKTVEEINMERDRAGHNSDQYKEAQPFFIKGFRDYYKGQYQRAYESFTTCVSLFPQHPQCQQYLILAKKRYDELVQYHMILGSKYKEQSQYNACIAEYKNVLEMLGYDKTQKIAQEARSGLDACTALAGEKY